MCCSKCAALAQLAVRPPPAGQLFAFAAAVPYYCYLPPINSVLVRKGGPPSTAGCSSVPRPRSNSA